MNSFLNRLSCILDKSRSFDNSNAVFSNNSMSWQKWLKLNNDHLPAIAFCFVSKKNFLGGRFIPLFNEMQKLRIVVFRGTMFGKFDLIILKLMRLFVKLTYRKQKNYKWVMTLGSNSIHSSINQILNIDDPQYNDSELKNILEWEKKLHIAGAKSMLVTTNLFTKKYFQRSNVSSPIHIIEQGHTSIRRRALTKNLNFSCAYSSPYIDIPGDKHGNHPTWGSELFVNEIIPKLIARDSEIEIHVVGRVGKRAFEHLRNFSQVKLYGPKNNIDNFEIISKCHVGLYPRLFDNYRRILKVYEYLGAGIPVVTFELEDTRMVSEKNIGVSVKTVTEFIGSVIELKYNKKLYNELISNVNNCGDDNSWANLGIKYDKLIQDS